jgi:hypothetical protein
MPDYNLFGLGTRSFEQLVQALSARIIGPGIVIFGDGPDGGREATFQGKLDFPTKRGGWGGSGIVQAKFLQRSHGKPKLDADWLLAQLAKEMNLFATRRKKSKSKKRQLRQPPDYYILATNVTLSGTARTGGKDRLLEAMVRYKQEFGWKAFDIWDSDKIARYLDAHRDIATTYASWITSGDVLAAVLAQLEPKRPDFNQAMTAFLQKELLAAQFANLRQAGHTDQDRVALSRVFVDLPVADRQFLEPPNEVEGPDATTFLTGLLTIGEQRLSNSEEELRSGGSVYDQVVQIKNWSGKTFSSAWGRKTRSAAFHAQIVASTVDISKLDNVWIPASDDASKLHFGDYIVHSEIGSQKRPGRIVLLGGPGQGKTTLGQFACQVYRAALLNGRDVLRLIREQCGDSLTRLAGRRYPLHVDLKILAAYLANSNPDNPPALLEFIRLRISERVATEISPDDMKMWLKNYPWFVVFDGLDEVSASGNREATLRCISEFLVDADTLDADILVVATCRPQSYAREFDEKHYRHLWLIPLSDVRALDYGNRLLAVRHSRGADLATYQARLKAAASASATARLMRSPLQVTIMAALVERIGLPPEQRWSLFSEYYRVIYDRETERGTAWSIALRDFRTDVDMIHRQIGFALHGKSELSAGVEASLTHAEFREIVHLRLSAEGHSGSGLTASVDTLSEAVKDRLVFLAALTDKRVGFEIRSLQEFMAADFLMDAPDANDSEHDDSVRNRLESIAKVAHWRNVFLFAAGRTFAKEQRFRDSLEALCLRLNDSLDDPATRSNLGGSRLALDLIEDGSARNQPNSSRTLMRVAARLLDVPASKEHIRLVHQSDASTEGVVKEELERRLTSNNDFAWLTCWVALEDPCRRDKAWARDLASLHSPIEPSRVLNAFRVMRDAETDGPLTMLIAKEAHKLPIWDALRLFSSSTSTVVDPALAVCVKYVQGEMEMEGAKPSPRRVEAKLGPGFNLVFRSVQGTVGEIPAREKTLDWHMSWKVFLSGLNFVKSPGAATLANELEWLAAECGDLQMNPSWRLSYAPWPLASCVAACESSSDLKELAKKVRGGELGDTPIWQLAESRWSKKGITTKDLGRLGESKVPFLADICDVGVPLAVARLEQFVRDKEVLDLAFVENMLDALHTIADPWTRVQLTNFISRIQWYLDEPSAGSSYSLRIERIARKVVDANISLHPALVLRSVRYRLLDEVALEFCDTAGKAPLTRDGPRIGGQQWTEFAITLANEFLSNSSRTGLIGLLAQCPPVLGGKLRIPRELLDSIVVGDSLRTAALVLRLDQLLFASAEVPEISAHVIRALEIRPDWASRICQVFESTPGTTPEREELLLALLSCLPEEWWQLRQDVQQTLNAILMRRSTAGRKAALEDS